MFKLIMIAVLFLTSTAQSRVLDPATVIPTTLESDYMKSGAFGESPKFNEETIMLLNYIDWVAEQSEHDHEMAEPLIIDTDTPLRVEVDLFAFGVSSVSLEEGFGFVGDNLLSGDVGNLDPADWATSTPPTVWEAIDRLAKAYAAQHAVPVP